MKKLLVATSLLLASTSATAGVINAAGGVSWKDIPGTAINLDTTTSFTQWWTDGGASGLDSSANALLSTAVYDAAPTLLVEANNGNYPELTGIGIINTLPDSIRDTVFVDNGKPTCNLCQLTYSFGGFKFTTSGFDATDAWLNVYLDYNPSSVVSISNIVGAQSGRTDGVNNAIAAAEIAKAVDGDLWLSMDIEEFVFTTSNLLIDGVANPNAAGGVSFFATINGGLAQANIVQATFQNNLFDIQAEQFSANFFDTEANKLNKYANLGSGAIVAATVSEPGAIAIFSLGLIGLGLSARRRMNK
jgi:hypothetical protein